MERGYVKKMDVQGKTIACTDFELEDDILNEINTKRDFGNEKGKLVIQPVGILVIEFLLKHFDHLFQYDYTNTMELKLDAIVKGKTVWHELCNDFKTDLDDLCIALKAEEIVKKCEIKIDDEHSYMIGKYGPVIKKGTGKTVTFLSIKPDIDLKRLERGEYTLNELLLPANSSSAIGEYEGSPVYIKKGKFGLYASYANGLSKNLSSLGNRPPENITWLEVLPLLEEERKQIIPTALRTITKDLTIRSGKFGDYLFYKTEKMKKPTFLKLHGFKENHMECPIDTIKAWVETTYKISL
jgi:DNA topoisomerase-1